MNQTSSTRENRTVQNYRRPQGPSEQQTALMLN